MFVRHSAYYFSWESGNVPFYKIIYPQASKICCDTTSNLEMFNLRVNWENNSVTFGSVQILGYFEVSERHIFWIIFLRDWRISGSNASPVRWREILSVHWKFLNVSYTFALEVKLKVLVKKIEKRLIGEFTGNFYISDFSSIVHRIFR